MGKNRHSKDRLFLTATEWKSLGGKPAEGTTGSSSQSLPFDHCALSLTRYETPCCSPEGVVFDLLNLVPYIRKYKKNPVTGQPMTVDDIIRLNMAKNTENNWHCPVTFKTFNNHSHIVAIKTTKNVYNYEAVYELNIKTKNYVDLITSEPFTKADIITLYDPNSPSCMALRDINKFVHTKQLHNENELTKANQSTVRHNPATQHIMKEIQIRKDTIKTESLQDIIDKYKPEEYIDDVKKILSLEPNTLDINPGSTFTNQKAGASLTSSSAEISTSNITRLASAEEIREAKWKVLRKLAKKGFVQLQTSMGNLNLEIHCDMAQRASWNFIELCSRGYYDNTDFHRLLPGFMIQGGDPTGKGTGGESAWGKPFKDEFDSRLLHDSRGVLSMANSGSNSNSSQFFITFAPAKHLDYIHAVFGRVVGGMAVLDAIELVGKNKEDAPTKQITILKTVVFDSPYAEAESILIDEVKERMTMRMKEEKLKRVKPATQVTEFTSIRQMEAKTVAVNLVARETSSLNTVGKYLAGSVCREDNLYAAQQSLMESAVDEEARERKKQKKSNDANTPFSNFSSW